MNSILVVVAVEQELLDPLPYPCVKSIIGVGKTNAAINTMKAIMIEKPDLVINFGTAGALNKNVVPGMYRIGRVVQRDFDARPLASDIGIVPYDDTPLSIALDYTQGLTLSTGDNFVTSPPEVHSDLVDMEGWAVAKVCREMKVPLEMYKYVTDNADKNAAKDWLAQIRKGGQEFIRMLNDRTEMLLY